MDRTSKNWGHMHLSPSTGAWPLVICWVELPNLHTEQIIIQVLTAPKYGTLLLDTMGILLQASMEDITLETGLQGEHTNWSPTPGDWVMDKEMFGWHARRHNIQIQMSQHETNLPYINNIKIAHLSSKWLLCQWIESPACTCKPSGYWIFAQGQVQNSMNMLGQARGCASHPGAGQSMSDQVQGNGECGNKL